MVLGALVGLKSTALGTVFGGFGSLSRAARAIEECSLEAGLAKNVVDDEASRRRQIRNSR